LNGALKYTFASQGWAGFFFDTVVLLLEAGDKFVLTTTIRL
jgi:hypothetical protein